jgi:hypothetical protein
MTERFRGEEAAPASAPAEVPAAAEARDAPDVSGPAAWDGRPSLGGVWVAHPEVVEPARVRIARSDGGRSVEGWLFRRGGDVEGPPLQVSSEAAEALGLPPGGTVALTVVPLDRPGGSG